jgi:hypothetical protein
LVLLVEVLALVVFASGVMAQQKSVAAPAPAPAAPASTAPAKPMKAAKVEKFAGTVSSMDEAAKAVVVKSKKGEKTFMLDDTTKITRDGKGIAFADLKQGMNVSVSYKMEADKAKAMAITASAPKTVKAAPKKKTEEKPAEAPAK